MPLSKTALKVQCFREKHTLTLYYSSSNETNLILISINNIYEHIFTIDSLQHGNTIFTSCTTPEDIASTFTTLTKQNNIVITNTAEPNAVCVLIKHSPDKVNLIISKKSPENTFDNIKELFEQYDTLYFNGKPNTSSPTVAVGKEGNDTQNQIEEHPQVLKDKIKSLQLRVNNLEESNAHLNERNVNLNNDNIQLTSMQSELNDKIDSVIKDMISYKSQNKQLQSEITFLNSLLEKYKDKDKDKDKDKENTFQSTKVKHTLSSLTSTFNFNKTISFTTQPKIHLTQTERALLASWISPKSELTATLIYRASSNDNGDSGKFHLHCDNKHPTLTLIQTEDETTTPKRFGGYTEQPWESSLSVFKRDSKSFIFNLDDKQIHRIKPNSYAIWCDINHGPCFGGHDISLSDKCLQNKDSYIVNDYMFALKPQLHPQLQSNISDTTYFTVKEYEVYEIQMHK